MAEARYDTLEMYDGVWAVIDVWTGDAAEVNGIRQIGLGEEQADDLADLLNYLQAQREAATLQ
ncbi:hypothetical protein FHW20_002146 [Ochrobactrum intermedium]|uniref:Uncharacterized protein n=2 Tax=Brucella intermedia TaxID=94625 RepID=A0ABR6APL0_9HYPH|nr:hypothetical protein [Brucella intermedia]MBA8851211.1 hypothetical protein [Brucella intermedia]